MSKLWKLSWDISATIAFVFVWYKTFVFFGELLPGFGYIIGAMIGLITGWIFGALLVHLIEAIIVFSFEKISNLF